MKYFGTDGIRGRLKIELTDKLILKVAKAIVLHYNKFKLKRTLLIGNDSRASSDYILTKLCTILLKNDINVHSIGLCSSPCLAYLTKKYNYPLGLMISASHNPAEYNGLKFFNSKGEKVSDEFENNFEILMDKHISLKNNSFSSLEQLESLKDDYISHLKTFIKFDFPIILDCANGGTSEICSKVFAKQEKINIKPNGANINENSGCTHIEMLSKLCIKKQKIGFAFDGDGDRIYIVDKDATIISGDKILYILSKFYQSGGDVCVGTIYTNSGLEKALSNRQISLRRSDVGDKKVFKLMNESSSILGGEDSGHIILKSFMNTGDGVLIAILLANILHLSQLSLKQLLEKYFEHYQFRKDFRTDDKSIIKQILEDEKVKEIVKSLETENVKIIIRPSGTEPVIRLFVEHENQTTAKNAIEKLHNTILFSIKTNHPAT